MSTTITDDLADILSANRHDGDFYVAGRSDRAAPGLEVAGLGRIALPLLAPQAEQLIALAMPSPFGRGQETLVDTNVRKTWQIPMDRVALLGRHWPDTLAAIVTQAAAGLGVKDAVTAEPYKLLVYDTGSFFVEHRDTEKSNGMFATLVINLPSVFSGGELIVRHKGKEVFLNLNSADANDLSFAAFYADCVHEVRPVTAGYRLTLIYNLLRQGGGSAPTPPAYDEQTNAIAALLVQWAEQAGDDTPQKLIYPLEHAYTSAELGFDALKNADAAAARVLVPASEEADCELHLALMSIEESGSAEQHYARRRRGRTYYRDDDDDDDEHDDDFEIIEVLDRDMRLSQWRAPDGGHLAFGPLPFAEEEFCPSNSIDDMEPDEQHFHEATGNEGASYERTYQRAAMVLWPRARKLKMLSEAGPAVSLPYLAGLAARWTSSGDGKNAALWLDAHALSGQMLLSWPNEPRYKGASDPEREASMISTLIELDDLERIDEFLAQVPSKGRYGALENTALVRAIGLLSPQRGAALIEQIVTRNAHMGADACADLLARMVALPAGANPHALLPAAVALVETLLGERANPHPAEPWHRPAPITPDLVDTLLYALATIEAISLAERLVGHMLANTRNFDFDAVLTEAALRLAQRPQMKQLACIGRLHAACVEHLRARVGESLAPPADFARPCTLACGCDYCAALGKFLADPLQPEWILKAAETHRRHVEATITQSRCDLDVTTRTQGKPHSLIATKNLKSYARRVAQREADLANLTRLDVAPGNRMVER